MVNRWLGVEAKEILARAGRRMAVDGGGLRIRGVTPDGYVRLQLTGACARCPRHMLTLDVAIETPLRERLTGLRGVELVAPDAVDEETPGGRV
jgi:Fe-S cluster biogenesis protein NfuA